MSNDDARAGEPLGSLSDAELGRRVRKTPTFRAAVACSRIAEEVQSLRDDDLEVYERLIDGAHSEQGSGVKVRETTAEIIDAYVEVLADHPSLASDPEEAASKVSGDLIDTEEVGDD